MVKLLVVDPKFVSHHTSAGLGAGPTIFCIALYGAVCLLLPWILNTTVTVTKGSTILAVQCQGRAGTGGVTDILRWKYLYLSRLLQTYFTSAENHMCTTLSVCKVCCTVIVSACLLGGRCLPRFTLLIGILKSVETI